MTAGKLSICNARNAKNTFARQVMAGFFYAIKIPPTGVEGIGFEVAAVLGASG